MTMTSARVSYLYDLMDAAYDAAAIHDQSRTLGHAPIVDRNFRADHQAKAEWGREVERLKLIHMPDFDDLIYDFRTMAERVNARLKDEFGSQISPCARRDQGQMPSHVRHRRARRRSDHPCRRLQDRPCLTQLGAPARRRKIHLAQGIMQEAQLVVPRAEAFRRQVSACMDGGGSGNSTRLTFLAHHLVLWKSLPHDDRPVSPRLRPAPPSRHRAFVARGDRRVARSCRRSGDDLAAGREEARHLARTYANQFVLRGLDPHPIVVRACGKTAWRGRDEHGGGGVERQKGRDPDRHRHDAQRHAARHSGGETPSRGGGASLEPAKSIARSSTPAMARTSTRLRRCSTR